MIDYTEMFTAIQAAEKELRGMGLRVTPDGKLTPQAEREVELLLARHGINNAKGVLDSRNILHLVPIRGRKPVLTQLQNAQREYERTITAWGHNDIITQNALGSLLGAITDTLAGQELAAMAELRRASERETPMFKIKVDPNLAPGTYRYEVDRSHDPLKDGTLKGKIVYGPDGPIGVATGDPGPTPPPWKVYGFDDLIEASNEAMLKAIMGQALPEFKTLRTWDKTPEAQANTYRKGPVKEESRKPSVLTIKERARVAFSFPVGSINSAMLGDALGDAYKAGAESVKPETAYSGELRAAMQGHGYSGGANTEWGNLLRDVATMVRNMRERRGY